VPLRNVLVGLAVARSAAAQIGLDTAEGKAALAGFVIDPDGEGVRAGVEAATLSDLLHPVAAGLVPLFFVLMGVEADLGSLAAPASLLLGAALIAPPGFGSCLRGPRGRGPAGAVSGTTLSGSSVSSGDGWFVVAGLAAAARPTGRVAPAAMSCTRGAKLVTTN